MNGKHIISIKNNEDSLWLEIVPNEFSFKILDEIFKLSEGIEEFDNLIYGNKDYDAVLNSNYASLHLDEDGYVAYLIFTKEKIHVILRKVGSFENIKTALLKRLEA